MEVCQIYLQFNFAAQGIMAIMDLGMCQSSSYLLFSLLLGSMLGQESIIKEELQNPKIDW